MTLPAWIDLAGLGAYAIYIGGAYLLVFVALAVEIALVVLRHRNIRRYLADGGSEDTPSPSGGDGGDDDAMRGGARP